MSVRVGLATGGEFQTIPCAPGARVLDVIDAAGLTITLGDQLTHNGVAVRPEHKVADKALIMLSRPIEGG